MYVCNICDYCCFQLYVYTIIFILNPLLIVVVLNSSQSINLVIAVEDGLQIVDYAKEQWLSNNKN